MKNPDTTTMIIGGLAIWWMYKKYEEGLEALEDAKDKSNIFPETGEFISGLIFGAKNKYSYWPDQSGSPNPPTQAWWEMAQDLGANEAAPPIRVARGTAVPTSPIIGVHPPGTAERIGGNVRAFFTEGKLLKTIDPFPETQEILDWRWGWL